jgi:hypothetical protein
MATIKTASEILAAAFEHNMQARRISDRIVPCLIGDPGIGKTAAVEAAADEAGVEYSSVIWGQYDPTELAGFPVPDLEKKEMIRLRPSYLPFDSSGFLNLDEVAQAPMFNQNLAAQLANEHRVGEHKLGEGWIVCATANKASNRAGTTPMPTHLRDRLTFIEIDVDPEAWVEWALVEGLAPEVISFIQFNPENLAKFATDAQSCPSPRSWAKVSHILGMGMSTMAERVAIDGSIGPATGAEFAGFLALAKSLPTPKEIYADPKGVVIPNTGEANMAAALAGALASTVDRKSASAFITYLSRWDQQEFAAFAIRAAVVRDKTLNSTASFRDWYAKEGSKFI